MQKVKLFDFQRSKRYWGHDFELMSKLDKEGWLWRISIHHPETPSEGDAIALGGRLDHLRAAKIIDVESCGNPNDMYFLEINLLGGWEYMMKHFPELKCGCTGCNSQIKEDKK